MSTDIELRSTIAALVAQRDECLRLAQEGLLLLHKAVQVHKSFSKYGEMFRDGPVSQFYGLNLEKDYMAEVRKNVDRSAWRHVLDLSGMRGLMDSASLDEFDKQVTDEPPEFTDENIRATMISLYQDSDKIFRRGLVNAFSALRTQKKTNRGQRLNKRIILVGALSPVERYSNGGKYVGGWSYYGKQDRAIDDLERVFRILDGEQTIEYGRISQECSSHLHSGRGEWWRVNRYMHIKPHCNGNLHIEFQRDDLLEKANRIIADECGNQLKAA